MNKYKTLKSTIITTLLALVIAFVAAAAALLGGKTAVHADGKTYALNGSTVFYTAIRGAEIGQSESEKDENQADHYFTQFAIRSEQTVEYRQNLAYSWISSNGKDDGERAPEAKKFSMELGFADGSLDKDVVERFVIRFQSQQYAYTEDEISENFVVFTPTDTGIDVALTDKLEDDTVLSTLTTVAYGKHIVISFGAFAGGEYEVRVGEKDATPAVGKFKNVYEPYASYVSSGDEKVIPLTFSAEFKDGADTEAEESVAKMTLYDISGQSFEQKELSGTWQVTDNAAPVMCFDETPSFLRYGKTISFDYKVIDVLASSPRSTAYYYILSGEQYAATDFDYDKTDYSAKDEDDKDEDDGDNADGDDTSTEPEEPVKSWKDPYISVSSSSSIRLIKDDNTFIPADMVDNGVYGLVKIYYELADVSGSTAIKDKVFVNWYVPTESLVDVYALKGNTDDNHSYFLKLIDDKAGVTYATEEDLNATQSVLPPLYEGEDENNYVRYSYKQTIAKFQTEYQAKIDAAIAELEDGKVYAGSDNKFYLPAIEYDFMDEYFGVHDYKFSVYYKAKTSGSNTNLAYNKLAIDLKEADVTYRFTIFITDEFGNPMRYPSKEEGTDDEVVWKEITTDDIWDEDFEELLPRFEIDVSYKEATAEDPDSLSLAYVGTNYSGVKFDINGVSGTYSTVYKLYVFDRNAYNRDHADKPLAYDEFIKQVADLFANAETRQYFTTVKASSELLETDDNYELFKSLNWNANNVSFTPQTVEDFYVVELTLTDTRSQTSTRNYATVAASVETNSFAGESDWVENNVTSIVLLTIAGICFIALLALLIIKPKDKGDIDTVYDEVKKDSKKKK